MRRQLADQGVDLRLGPDVDAAGGLVENQNLRASPPATSRARSSAGCRRRGRPPSRRGPACARAAGRTARAPALRSRARRIQRQPGQPVEDRERRVVQSARGEHQALSLAVLGHEADARARSRAPGCRDRRPACHAARSVRATVGSRPNSADATSERPAPIKPRETDDLARAHARTRRPRTCPGTVSPSTRSTSSPRRPRELRRRSTRRAGGRSSSGRDRDSVERRRRARGDVTSIAQHA